MHSPVSQHLVPILDEHLILRHRGVRLGTELQGVLLRPSHTSALSLPLSAEVPTLRSKYAFPLTFLFSSNLSTTSLYPHPTSAATRFSVQNCNDV
jgi:hypothetical protein